MLTLETTVEKIKIRQHLLSQFIQFVPICGSDNITICSLPASSWRWEDNIVNHMMMNHPEKKLSFCCFDKNEKLKSFFPYPVTDKYNLGEHELVAEFDNISIAAFYKEFFDYIKIYSENEKSFSWADYCGNPSRKYLKDFSEAICEGDVIYTTFATAWRCDKNITKKILNLKEKTSAGEAIIAEMENIIETKIGKNFTRIYHCSYVGNRVPMITIGWHFVKNSPIKPLYFDWHKNNAPKKAPHVEPVQALVESGVSDSEIFQKFPNLTVMQLAGAKAAVTRKKNNS